MTPAEATIRAEQLWPGENPAVEAHHDGWLVITPHALHLTHLMDKDGNPDCHPECKSFAELIAMVKTNGRYRGEIIDRLSVLEHYADHLELLVTLQKIVDADVEHFKGALRVPGVRVVCDELVKAHE